MAIKEINLGLPVPRIENSGIPGSKAQKKQQVERSVSKMPQAEASRADNRNFQQELDRSLQPPKPSSPEARMHLEIVKSMAKMELMNLNGMLLSAFGGGGGGGMQSMGGMGGMGATGMMPMLNLWRQIQMMSAGAGQNIVEPDRPSSEIQRAKPVPEPERRTEPEADPVVEKTDLEGALPDGDTGSKSWIHRIIEKTANAFGVDPNLVKAVVQTESGFKAKVVSHAGAMGLMQLMPGTARDLGVADPFDPEQNVAGGVRYLKMMLDKYGGNVNNALAAYNWGPGNLDRNRSSGWMPNETRNYIRIVGSLYRRFSKDEQA